ncbi:MAG: DUF4859 domain-containing protein [Prevotella sp.]|nr:DUF4859 domain-containing protein [Prevotella sp.]
MKKNILYIMMASVAIGLTSCSADYEDASQKHVYTDAESPYLRTDVEANVSVMAEFNKGHVTPLTVNLNDYASIIQSKLGMTVDEMVSGVATGKVVFYNINSNRGVWDKTAPTKGTTGWYYSKTGLVTDAASQAGSVELDASAKALVIQVPEESLAGVTFATNVGFAVNNGKDYDQYVRFNIQFLVSDPGLATPVFTIPAGDYASFEIPFADYQTAIETCMGMTVKEFNAAVQDAAGDIALYMVDADGKWITGKDYTANGLGYWCDGDGNPRGWGDGCAYFVETHDGTVGVGRYPGIASGTKKTVHFVYASKSDPSKYVEFVCSATFE